MKSTKVNELFGAKYFQKIVFIVEELKFTLLDKFFPNYEKNYENRLKKILEKELSKTADEEKRSSLIENYQRKILLSRKENVIKKNRNYHINIDNPNDFLTYLNKNKAIHLNGLIKNGIVYLLSIPLVTLCSGTLLTIGYILLSVNTISSIINFECVNLQNYNIKRINNSREKLERLYEKRKERDIKEYGSISTVVSKELNLSEEIPSVERVIERIETKEELEQMRSLLLKELNKRNIQNDNAKKLTLKQKQ